MPSINTRQINGVVRTSEPVWSNLERLAEASLSWFTYDTHNGKYSWVINAEGNAVATLSEADIIGPIQISSAGLTNMYNAVEIEFADTVLRDQPRYVTINLPTRLRNQYEPDNTLQMSSEFVNNQPQAEYLASVTLAQTRLDRTVTIVMDYTKINLQAGDIVQVNSDTYGWILKEFRIMRVREIEGDDGSLRIEFTMSEYDDSIYSQNIANFLVDGSSGIRAIGAIGVPGTPVVTLTTLDSLPAQTVDSTVPAGIVERMQFWAGNVAVTGNVANTSFDLYGTVASTNASSFTVGETASFTTTALKDGTWTWKTRGVNAMGVGPFSNLSGNAAFERNQAPDVVKIDTPVVTANGTVISTTQTVPSIVYHLTDMTLDERTAYQPGYPRQANAPPPARAAGTVGTILSNQTLTINVATEGWYKFDAYYNFGDPSSGTSSVQFYGAGMFLMEGGVFGSGNEVGNMVTSLYDVDSYMDADLHFLQYLQPDTYHLELFYANVPNGGVRRLNIMIEATGPYIDTPYIVIGNEPGSVGTNS